VPIETQSYIGNLPVGTFRPIAPSREGVFTAEETVSGIDINNLPNGVVTGSNIIQFPENAKPEIRLSVALSLLAAQRVASSDPVLLTPEQWIDRHNTVLRNLNWQVTGGGVVDSEFESINAAVHEAIVPFLEAAFSGGATAATLIFAALKQLREIDKESPWITLFDSQSRHFDVTEYQFSVVEVQESQVTLRLASARFNASFGRTQVLFFRLGRERAKFDSARQTLLSNSDLLTDMNDGLKTKLAAFTKTYIQELPVGARAQSSS
jgi:hypothetical protein